MVSVPSHLRDSPLKHLPERHFLLTVIDECSQAMETDCWIVAGGSFKLVLAGYHLQLPPTILSIQTAKGLSLTMMEKVVDSSEVTRVLTVQEKLFVHVLVLSDALLRPADSRPLCFQ